nr:hypothetical protein [Novosphingobium sp. FKTRR1]
MRRGQSFAFSFLAYALEPLIIIATISILFSVLGVAPRYGSSLTLFLATGVVPIYMFIHTSMRVRTAVAPGLHRIRYAMEQPLDHVIVHAALHMISTSIMAIGFFGSLYYFAGVDQAVPFEPLTAVKASLAIFVMGASMGMLNAVIARFLPIWDVLWPAIARASLHFSGPYFVAAFLAPNVRGYFALNPILHGVNWFRHAFYPFYPNQMTDHGFVLTVGAVMLTAALLLLNSSVRYLEDKE